jgi:hypothetical protein
VVLSACPMTKQEDKTKRQEVFLKEKLSVVK